MKHLTSRQNPLVREYRGLADEPEANGTRLLLDGAHLVREAQSAGLSFESVAVASSRLSVPTEEGDLANALEAAGAAVVSVSDAVFPALSPVRSPSGIVAIARRPPVDLSAICRIPNGFTVVAIDVQDPGNLGSLIRAAEAGGVTGVIVAGASAHPFSWKALRGSMGSSLRLPIARDADTDGVLRDARAAGARMVASVARGGPPPDEIAWGGPVALLIGGEAQGLAPRLAAQCDDRVTIPMAPGVDSLNVAVAAAILIYAARRQRSPHGGAGVPAADRHMS